MEQREKRLLQLFFYGLFAILLAPWFFFYVMVPDLPFDSRSKISVIEVLEHEGMTKLATENDIDWYGEQADQGTAAESLKRKMAEKGWVFIQQEGAGYFFERGSEKVIITSQKWTSEYVLFRVPAGVL